MFCWPARKGKPPNHAVRCDSIPFYWERCPIWNICCIRWVILAPKQSYRYCCRLLRQENGIVATRRVCLSASSCRSPCSNARQPQTIHVACYAWNQSCWKYYNVCRCLTPKCVQYFTRTQHQCGTRNGAIVNIRFPVFMSDSFIHLYHSPPQPTITGSMHLLQMMLVWWLVMIPHTGSSLGARSYAVDGPTVSNGLRTGSFSAALFSQTLKAHLYVMTFWTRVWDLL